jgi:hypothetical protein
MHFPLESDESLSGGSIGASGADFVPKLRGIRSDEGGSGQSRLKRVMGSLPVAMRSSFQPVGDRVRSRLAGGLDPKSALVVTPTALDSATAIPMVKVSGQ